MNKRTLYKYIKNLYGHVSNQRRKQLVLLIILMIFASLAEVISIGALIPFISTIMSPDRVFNLSFMKPFIDVLDIKDSKQLLLPLTIIFSIAILLSSALRLFLIWFQNKLSFSIGTDISYKAYRLTLFQPYSTHIGRNSSEFIVGIANKSKAIVNSTIMPVLTIINSLFMTFMILLTLVMFEPMLILSAFLGFVLIYATVIGITRKPLYRESKHISIESNHVVKTLQEGLGGIRDVLINGSQELFLHIFLKADLQLKKSQAKITFIGSFPRFGIEALGMILIAALAYSFSGNKNGSTSSFPILVALALGVQRLLPLLQQAFVSWTSIQGSEANLIHTLTLLDQPLPSFANQPPPKPIKFEDNITLNNIYFRYAPDLPWVIKDLKLIIPKGSHVGFIGTTGSGKSTLLDIMMGLLQPTEGEITIDGVPLTAENTRSWQVHIAHVPQAIFLADSSISENIAFGVRTNEIDYDRVRQGACKAQIHETIESFNDKYLTMVGERGVRLSGGQRQRIGIARAMYKNADVIVFDEATSALDNNTEEEVMNTIQNMESNITIFIIAHRLTTLKNCDLIIELVNGEIKRVGNYSQIIGTLINKS